MIRHEEKDLEVLSKKLQAAVAKIAVVMDSATEHNLADTDEFSLCAERLEVALLWLNMEATICESKDPAGEVNKFRDYGELSPITLSDSQKETKDALNVLNSNLGILTFVIRLLTTLFVLFFLGDSRPLFVQGPFDFSSGFRGLLYSNNCKGVDHQWLHYCRHEVGAFRGFR